MSLACGYFPSPLKCDARAAKSLSAEKHTIVFRPSDKNLSSELQSPIIIGIHLNIESSHHSLAFSIWALRSISPHISNEIHRVNSIIHSFNMLSENSTDELWKNMPKLHRLAQSESCSILDQKHISTHSIDTSPATKEDLPDPDLVSLEHFVSKSGRMKMRSDLVDFQSRSQSKSNRLDKLMSPNNHSDLFVPPNLEPRSMLSDRSSHTSKKNQLNKNLKLENDLKYGELTFYFELLLLLTIS